MEKPSMSKCVNSDEYAKKMAAYNLANNVKILRTAKNWTQRDLSIASGVTSETICRIETGNALNPNEPTLRCLASALNITLEDLQK